MLPVPAAAELGDVSGPGEVRGPGEARGDVSTVRWPLFCRGAACLLGRSGKAGRLLCLGAVGYAH